MVELHRIFQNSTAQRRILHAAETWLCSIFDILTRKLNVCREWNKCLTADQAEKLYEQATKLEQEFGEYFTGIVLCYNKYLLLEIFKTVKTFYLYIAALLCMS